MESNPQVCKIRTYSNTPTIAIPRKILDQFGKISNFSVSIQKDPSGCPCIVYKPVFAGQNGCSVCGHKEADL